MSIVDLLRQSAKPVIEDKAPVPAHVMDTVGLEGIEEDAERAEMYKQRAGEVAYYGLRRDALSVLHAWAEDDESEDGLADNLETLLVGLVDEDHNGKLSKDEEEAVAVARAAMVDYLQQIGVEDADIEGLLEGDSDAAETVRDAVLDAEGDDDTLDRVAYGDYDDEGDGEDGEVMDKATVPTRSKDVAQGRKASGVRKKFVSFINGKRAVRWKLVAGKPRKLSGAQKLQLAKARMNSKKPGALRAWKRSMTARIKSGIKPKTPA